MPRLLACGTRLYWILTQHDSIYLKICPYIQKRKKIEQNITNQFKTAEYSVFQQHLWCAIMSNRCAGVREILCTGVQCVLMQFNTLAIFQNGKVQWVTTTLIGPAWTWTIEKLSSGSKYDFYIYIWSWWPQKYTYIVHSLGIQMVCKKFISKISPVCKCHTLLKSG